MSDLRQCSINLATMSFQMILRVSLIFLDSLGHRDGKKEKNSLIHLSVHPSICLATRLVCQYVSRSVHSFAISSLIHPFQRKTNEFSFWYRLVQPTRMGKFIQSQHGGRYLAVITLYWTTLKTSQKKQEICLINICKISTGWLCPAEWSEALMLSLLVH